ncbi:MAG: iron export ABC transporter permease subunit FetB [Coriobacteriia bacterium]|nr:iron export ABC transporter permease subunit FetB [Coriobacteriia bacterium]
MSGDTGVIVIGWTELALATLFMLFTGGLAMALQLGLTKSLWIATLRTYLQLLALGLVLNWVFAVDEPLIVFAIITVMTAVAAQAIVKRAPQAPRGTYLSAWFAMALPAFIITFAVTGLIIHVEPWYLPRYVIPIAGMIIGNSMNGIALALERSFADMDSRENEILALTALGATPWEAARESVRTALRAGMIPGINMLSTVGIVFIPGMMAGQVLAGADPLVAAPYQIVVMMMVATADVLGSTIVVLLTFRRRFTPEGIFLEKGLRPHAR